MSWRRPEPDAIREALYRHAPELAGGEIRFLAEGWEFWAFTAGDHVLRFPRQPVDLHRLPESTDNLRSLELERRLLPALASWLSVPVPEIDLYVKDGPNGAPFAGHRLIPGEPILDASRAPGPGVGRALGRLLHELRSFPREGALELGVPLIEGPSMREQRARHYEAVIRRVFPIVSCEARMQIEQVFEPYLKTASNFEFEPCLVHQDLDMNTLIDPASGEISGVIDFGGAVVGHAALDLWLPLFGFKRLGIEEQLEGCLREAGLADADLDRMEPEVRFIDFNFPLTDILSGLERNDADQVEDGVRHLNASLPAGLVCP